MQCVTIHTYVEYMGLGRLVASVPAEAEAEREAVLGYFAQREKKEADD